MKTRCWLMAVVQAAWLAGAVSAAEIRYSDVFYLDEWKQAPLQLKAITRVPIMFSRDQSNVIAHIPKGQVATVIGWTEATYYVIVQIATGPARGWVDVRGLETPPQEVVDKLRIRRERMLANREVIARHEV